MKKVLIHTRQAGSASSFIPVVRELSNMGCDFLVLSESYSTDLWNKSEIKTTVIKTFNKDILNSYNPDFILTGTSLKVEEDAKYWNWAYLNSIPSLAYIESRVNYKQRFTVYNDFDRLPNIIGVADELIKKRLKEEGFRKNIIKVLPQPRFDELIKGYLNKSHQASKHITIFTNPSCIGEGSEEDNVGYNSQDSLIQIINCLKRINDKKKITSKIYLKLHPRESIENYTKIDFQDLKKGLDIDLSKSDSNSLIFNSCLVIGFISIVLLDSSILGIPTVSYQPSKLKKNSDITYQRNNLRVIKDIKSMESFLESIIGKNLSNEKGIMTKKAGYNFANFIVDLIK
tara:strand:- start:5016 stop:6044 length:1029 start_codon:yes stop_codon:yes gene_type:complete